MSEINKRIISTSTNALYNKAKVTGYLDLKYINQLYVYDYYLDFTKNNVNFNNEHIILRDQIYNLKNKLQNICNFKNLLLNLSSFNNIQNNNNIAPILLQPIVINLTTESSYALDPNLINQPSFYYDENNDSLKGVYLYLSEVTTGSFTYNSLPVVSDIYVDINDLSNIVYIPDNGVYSINIPFRYLDNNVNPLYSIKYNYTINVNNFILTNQPSTVGDITIIRPNRSITVITLQMLTSDLTPPYNDPEGDSLNAIRIDEISTANKGVFYYNNVPIIVNLVIPVNDIINGLLEHRSANQNDISSDVFNFSVRDSGSLIWVN